MASTNAMRRLVKWSASTVALISASQAFGQNAASISAAPSAASTPAAAGAPQASASPGVREANVGDIVVTARRRAERLIDVPVAVTALSSETLVRNNVTSLARIQEVVPFVTLTPVPAGQGALFSIRGVGSAPADPGVQQSVLVNIDNVMIGRGRIAQAGLFDLAQVEVLKGPQALFFGKNSPAGVVSVTTADPGTQLGGYLRAGYEFVAGERYVEGAVGGPLTDTLRMRVAGRYSFIDGYLNNVAQPSTYPCSGAGCPFAPFVAAGATIPGADHARLPHGSDWGGRITAVWSPASDFTAKMKYSYGDSKVVSYYDTWCTRGQSHFTAAGFVDSQSDCHFDDRITVSAFPAILTTNMPNANGGIPYNNVKTHIASLNADWTVNDHIGVNSITGFYKLDTGNSFVVNLSAIPYIYLANVENSTGISEEIRTTSKFRGPLNFVAGAFFDRVRQRNGSSALLTPRAPDPATGRFYTFDRFDDFTTYSQSGFVQLRLQIESALELAGGVRYTHDSRDSVDGNSYVNPNAAALVRAAGNYFVRSYSGSNWSPEVTLTWHPALNQTLYAAYKTGYKAGGFSYPLTLTTKFTAANTTFRPERSSGFEVGYKAQLLDRRLTLQAAGYLTTYKDQQVSSFDQATITYLVGNAAKSRLKGVELQAVATPIKGLQLRLNAGYNDARYVSYPQGPCPAGFTAAQGCIGGFTNLSDHLLPRAPQWQGNAGFTYDTPLNDSLKIEFTGDALHSSSYFLQDNLDPYAVQRAFWKFNASVSLDTLNDRWRLSLIGRNLTNKWVGTYSNDTAGASPGNQAIVPERPREVALEARFNF